MSSSPTAPTSTTDSSTSSPSPAELPTRNGRVALVACGAIAQPCAEAVQRHAWPVDVHPLPPLLHNRPHLIADRVESLGAELAERYDAVAVGYADCGTYGALDEVCRRRGWHRMAGLHCYDLYAGSDAVERLWADEAGTYVLTDFLVRSFDRTVLVELGLDRHPELREEYFGHYRRVVWLRQDRGARLEEHAREAAARLGLPLVVVDTGHSRLEQALERLLARTGVS